MDKTKVSGTFDGSSILLGATKMMRNRLVYNLLRIFMCARHG